MTISSWLPGLCRRRPGLWRARAVAVAIAPPASSSRPMAFFLPSHGPMLRPQLRLCSSSSPPSSPLPSPLPSLLGEQPDLDNDEDRVDLSVHEELLDRYQLQATNQQQVFVIQPYDRSAKETLDDAHLKMEETLSLVTTLGWVVVDAQVAGTTSFNRTGFFGGGNLDMFASIIPPLATVSAVFVSTYRLSTRQRLELEETFQRPVLDRYNVILQIFQRHARTPEARMQVALAEIPYMMRRLREDLSVEHDMKHSKQRKGEDHFETMEMHLKRRAQRIKGQLAKVRQQRQKLRSQRQRLQIPVVAVVGYTNCGKTSLIKALTDSAKLAEPRDQLFATLDVTAHEGVLPDALRALFLDTVGFISDIPTSLIASFSATLEDAAEADLLIHVRDVSHPAADAQNKNVLRTLTRLGVPKRLLDSMIVLGNKIDKIEPAEWKDAFGGKDFLPISATCGYGLDVVSRRTEAELMRATNRKRTAFRVRTGQDQFDWLKQNAIVAGVEVDPKDANYSILHMIVTPADVDRFRKTFLG